MADPFERVPDITFVEYDPVEITNSIIGGFEAAWLQDTREPLKLYRPDARRMFLEYVAGIVIQQNVALNYAGWMNLLKYMRKDYLDGWGGNWGERGYRLPASRALTTLRFQIPAPTNVNVPIPFHTLVASTASALVTFQTTAVALIPVGSTSVDVPAECTIEGIVGNDFLPGQVNRLVSSISFAVTVSNTTTTAGGAEIQGDESYRDALWTVPESLSIAGPAGAYLWWAKKANPAIIDVAVYSAPDIAGEVHVYPLVAGGQIPSDEILEQVQTILSANELRPVADYVTTMKPAQVDFDIDLDWFGNVEDATILDSIHTNVDAAVADFVLWTRSRVGRDIIPSELHRRILNAGAKRIVLREPIDRSSAYNEVPIAQNIRVNFGGLEEVL
jgi:phage-related baseplate assembly protein